MDGNTNAPLSDSGNTLIRIGGNHPPPDDPAIELQKRADELTTAINAWLTGLTKLDTDEQAGKANDFLAQLRAIGGDTGTIEKQRDALVRPLNTQVADINLKYKALRAPVLVGIDKIKSLINAYNLRKENERKERERVAREEAAEKLRKAQEAEEEARKAVEAAARAEKAKRDAELAAQEAEAERKRLADEAMEKARLAEEAEKCAAEEKDAAEKKRLEDIALKAQQDAEAAADHAAEESERLAETATQAAVAASAAVEEAKSTDVVGAVLAAEATAKEAKQADKIANKIGNETVVAKGEMGGRGTGLRDNWVATLTDSTKAFKRYKDHPKVTELLTSLGQAEVRTGVRDLPGFVIENKRGV